MKAIGIIPARFASSRFPGKPLAMILGKSLIQRSYEQALECPDLDQVVVATDDERILSHVKAFGGNAVMTSLDCPTGTDRLHEVIEKYPDFADYEIIVNVQGDEPCVDPAVISTLVKMLKENPDVPVSTPITPLLHQDEAANPSVVKCVKDKDGYALYFSRSLIPWGKDGMMRPGASYFRHIGLYAYRNHFLRAYGTLSRTPLQHAEDLEQLKVLEHGFAIKLALIESNGMSLEVNHPEDIQKIEKYLCKQNSSL